MGQGRSGPISGCPRKVILLEPKPNSLWSGVYCTQGTCICNFYEVQASNSCRSTSVLGGNRRLWFWMVLGAGLDLICSVRDKPGLQAMWLDPSYCCLFPLPGKEALPGLDSEVSAGWRKTHLLASPLFLQLPSAAVPFCRAVLWDLLIKDKLTSVIGRPCTTTLTNGSSVVLGTAVLSCYSHLSPGAAGSLLTQPEQLH